MTTITETAWEKAHGELHPAAQLLVRALAVLDGQSISLTSAAAVLEVFEPRAAEIAALLAADGWGTVTEDRFEVAICARLYLAELAPTVPAAEVDQVLTRVATMVWPHAGRRTPSLTVRADVVSVIRAAGQYRRGDIVATVARAAWRSPIVRKDPLWCRELAQCGNDAAIASRQPNLFVELLNNSAEVYASVKDWPEAERAWLRALAIVEDLDDTERSVHFLGLLTDNYLNWKRPHKAIDMLLKIVSIHRHAGDTINTVHALRPAARVMANANRPDAAINYLTEADQLLRALPDVDPEITSLHATILSELGQAHAQLGRTNSARNCYHKALTMVVDTDEHTADQIRALQKTLRPTAKR